MSSVSGRTPRKGSLPAPFAPGSRWPWSLLLVPCLPALLSASSHLAPQSAGPVSEAGPEIAVTFVPAGKLPFTTAFAYLPPISVETVNDERATVTRLYLPDGSLDEAALAALDEQLADKRRPGDTRHTTIDRRLLTLVFKAAWHFSATHVRVVSAYREPMKHREGFHGKGRALDFKLEGVKTPDLARFLRDELALVGVGQYTHRRTQFVHLDVRETTFHWFDGSPPGRRGGIARIPTEGTAARDAAHVPRDDLPDAL